MSVAQVNFNNINSVNSSISNSNASQKAAKTAQTPSFKADNDTFVYRQRKPSFWNKYKGYIGNFIGFVAAEEAGRILLSKQLVKMNPNFAWLIPFAIGIAGGIAGQEAAEKIGN